MSNDMGPLQVTPETLLSRAHDMVETEDVSNLSAAIAYVVAEWADEVGADPNQEQAVLEQVREMSRQE